MTNADGKEEAAAAESDARRKISGIDGCIVLLMSFFLSPSESFWNTVRRPTQFFCPNRNTIGPKSDKIYLTIVTFRFLLLFFAY